jgi:hypothetical protein
MSPNGLPTVFDPLPMLAVMVPQRGAGTDWMSCQAIRQVCALEIIGNHR